MAPDHGQPRTISRPVYVTVFGLLFVFWTALAVVAALVLGARAWDERDDDAAAAVPTSTAAVTLSPTPTAAPEPRPAEVPLTAAPVTLPFDTGEPEQHLFFHIECDRGLLVIITTDEHVFAESFCGPIAPANVEPFLGMPVRITIEGLLLELTSAQGARMRFGVARSWVEDR
jgi:hypothetical protein